MITGRFAGDGGRSKLVQRLKSPLIPDAKIDVNHVRPCPGCLLEDAVIIGDHGDMVTIELELQPVHLRHGGIGLDEEDADELLVEM